LYCTVRVRNVRGFLNSEKLIEILKDRFKTAFWRDLNIEHCVVRDAFDDAFLECKYDCDGRDILQLKNQDLHGYTMEFMPWSSDCGDINNFRSAENDSIHHYGKSQSCNDINRQEELVEGLGLTTEEKNVIHIKNVKDTFNNKLFFKFISKKFKSTYNHELHLSRCTVRQANNENDHDRHRCRYLKMAIMTTTTTAAVMVKELTSVVLSTARDPVTLITKKIRTR
jgi:hypothetical protein